MVGRRRLLHILRYKGFVSNSKDLPIQKDDINREIKIYVLYIIWVFYQIVNNTKG